MRYLQTNLVVFGVHPVEGSVDNGLNGVKAIQNLLRFIQVFPRAIGILQLQLDLGHCHRSIDVCILGVGVVDLVCRCGEESQALLAVCFK
jgi:hypothetical protein